MSLPSSSKTVIYGVPDLDSDSEDVGRKRKRQKYDADQDRADAEIPTNESALLIKSSSHRRRQRDAEYYLEDGSCVLLVEDTLFNVHRTMLSKDSSSFSTMFTLPQGDREAEGRSDENPIILTGDTAAEFRHFLWALYALPPELQIVHAPGADLTELIDRLIAIAAISSKYSFKSLETWALDAIQEYVSRKPSPILSIIPPPTTYTFPHNTVEAVSTHSKKATGSPIQSTAQLTRLVRLAQMCSHDRLLDTMIALLRALMSSSLQYAYLAMALADELDLRVLRGAAYLEVMQKSAVVPRGLVDWKAPLTDDSAVVRAVPPASACLLVTPAQKLRLLSGYYRLAGTWERLRMAPPHIEHSPSCGATWHLQGCTQSWTEFWKEKTRSDAVLSLGSADVIGRLTQVAREFDRWGSASFMHHQCRLLARASIQEEVRKVEDALPMYFSEQGE